MIYNKIEPNENDQSRQGRKNYSGSSYMLLEESKGQMRCIHHKGPYHERNNIKSELHRVIMQRKSNNVFFFHKTIHEIT